MNYRIDYTISGGNVRETSIIFITMKIPNRNFVALFLSVIILSGLMLYLTGIIPAFGEWYSYNPSLRLQIEAFLRGELAIQQAPYGIMEDWALGNGMHQAWGMGVPIIQLPFYMAGKLFGFFAFPERIIFIIFYVLVAAIFCRSLDSVTHLSPILKERLINRTVYIPAILFALLNPAFITMLQAFAFMIHEEVVAYSYLWSLMCLALMFRFIIDRRGYLYFIICIITGFSINLRPTHAAYGIITFLIAFYFARQRRTRFYWIGIPLFFSGILFSFITNYLRFGSPLEFGNSLQLLGSGYGYYVISFDNPTYWFPYTASVVELISALFFLDMDMLSLPVQRLLWQTNDLRGVQLIFKPYNLVTLILLLLGWIISVVSIKVSRKAISAAELLKKQIILALGIWSFASFIMLFIFYSRYPVLITRYLIDFAPAIIAGILIVYWFLLDYIHNKFPHKLSIWINCCISIAFSSWMLISAINPPIIRLPLFNNLDKAMLSNVTTAETAQKRHIRMQKTNGPPLPDGYRCGEKEYGYYAFNNFNWDISDSCIVSLVSTHFLNNPNCLAIDIEPLDNISGSIMGDYLNDIEVKVGIERFRKDKVISAERGKTIVYCSDGKKGYENSYYLKNKLVQIKWVDLKKYPNFRLDQNFASPPIKLTYLRKIN